MVEENNSNTLLAGKYWWGPDNFPDYALELFEDGKFAVFKSCDDDYDRPMTPSGSSFYAEGTYKVEGNSVTCTGSGIEYNFGWIGDPYKVEPEDFNFERTYTVADLKAHLRNDKNGATWYKDRLHGEQHLRKMNFQLRL